MFVKRFPVWNCFWIRFVCRQTSRGLERVDIRQIGWCTEMLHWLGLVMLIHEIFLHHLVLNSHECCNLSHQPFCVLRSFPWKVKREENILSPQLDWKIRAKWCPTVVPFSCSFVVCASVWKCEQFENMNRARPIPLKDEVPVLAFGKDQQIAKLSTYRRPLTLLQCGLLCKQNQRNQFCRCISLLSSCFELLR